MALTKVGKEGITGIDNSSDATAITIDSSENVLIGKTSSGIGTAGIELRANDDVLITSNGSQALYLNRLSSDGAIAEFRKDGTTVGSIGTTGGDLTIFSTASGHSGIRFHENGILPTNNAGALIDNDAVLGDASYRYTNLFLSGGVYLGGTGSANYLDDYEEGNFTVTISQPSSRGGTWSSAIGRYTKVGNKVSLYIDITGSGMYFTATSGYTALTGLPFTALQPTGSQNYAGSWSGNSVGSASGGSVYLNSSTIYIHNSNPNQNTSGVSGIGVQINYVTS